MKRNTACLWEVETRSTAMTTTLYDLIEAVNEEVPPEKDGLAIGIVLHLIERGKVRFHGDPGETRIWIE